MEGTDSLLENYKLNFDGDKATNAAFPQVNPGGQFFAYSSGGAGGGRVLAEGPLFCFGLKFAGVNLSVGFGKHRQK